MFAARKHPHRFDQCNSIGLAVGCIENAVLNSSPLGSAVVEMPASITTIAGINLEANGSCCLGVTDGRGSDAVSKYP